MSHDPVNVESAIYTARVNLMSARRLLLECVEELGDGESREHLADAGRLVDDTLGKIEDYRKANRWQIKE